REPEVLESLAGRLLRLEKRLDEPLAAEVTKTSNGQTLSDIAAALLNAIDPDLIAQAIRDERGPEYAPTETDVKDMLERRADEAVAPLAGNLDLRNLLIKIQQNAEQVIDVISRDQVLFAGASAATAQNAAATVSTFRDYLEQNRAVITALQILYARPYRQRLTEPMLKDLETQLRQTRADWTEDRLWEAFAAMAPAAVRGRTQAGRFADLIALVRFALAQQPTLEPFAESVKARFDAWLAGQQPPFTPEQRAWLGLIRDHIATSLTIEPDDFAYAPFSQAGGLGRADQLFGPRLPVLLGELNEVLVG
ncbi:MAG: type I restriction-modification enzyme R subunit C-terminal domain-containing protein, partial [Thermoflexales bacterium]